MTWSRTIAAGAALALLVSVGCGSAQKTESLDRGVRRYHEGLRWSRFSGSAMHIPPRERGDFLDERAEIEDDLHIDMYEIRRLEANADQRARVDIEYTWHLDSKGIVHTTTARQLWRRHGDRWLLVEERRLRGEPMPGVPEPLPDGEGEPDGDAGPGRKPSGSGQTADGGAAAVRPDR